MSDFSCPCRDIAFHCAGKWHVDFSPHRDWVWGRQGSGFPTGRGVGGLPCRARWLTSEPRFGHKQTPLYSRDGRVPVVISYTDGCKKKKVSQTANAPRAGSTCEWLTPASQWPCRARMCRCLAGLQITHACCCHDEQTFKTQPSAQIVPCLRCATRVRPRLQLSTWQSRGRDELEVGLDFNPPCKDGRR